MSFGLHTIDAQTTGSLRGVITDESTGETLPFVSIKIFENGIFIRGTDSDFDGNYSFSNITAGTYDIEISYVGLQTVRLTRVVIRVGHMEIVDLEFPEPKNTYQAGIMLAEVRVIAMGGRRILSAEDIDRMTTRYVMKPVFFSKNRKEYRKKKRNKLN